jgi:hypothetical protein
MEQNRRDALLKEYGEVSSNFRLLTDIRFKLLAFLPIATAAAAALKSENFGMASLGLSLFGLATTIGLAIYNTRNDQLYNELIGRAAEIERHLEIPEGAFANRPTPWFTVNLLGARLKIDHQTGVGTIYTASIALWLFGVFFPAIELGRRVYLSSTNVHAFTGAESATWTYFVALALAVLSAYLGMKSIQRQRRIRQRRMRKLAAIAVARLNALELSGAAEDPAFIDICSELAGVDTDKVRARARFYGGLDEASLKHYMLTEPKRLAMSHFVALLTDLPPRWIFDCATNRRGDILATRKQS